jgi:hypothetical protein
MGDIEQGIADNAANEEQLGAGTPECIGKSFGDLTLLSAQLVEKRVVHLPHPFGVRSWFDREH